MRLPALGIAFCALTVVTAVTACSTEVAAHSAPVSAQVVRPPAKGDVADPVRLRVPAIGVSTRVIALRLDARNRLIAPTHFDRVGWNKAGPEPGEAGASVIAGHVDSTSGPAVFHRLGNLRPGHRIHVDRADGSVVTFTVRRLARFPKDRVPGKEVYGSTGGAELRLITCGGTFDRERRSYRDNVVVFAS
ncbi:class F sortase [Streptosporangium lutulentum]|uniref:Sortase (Surface protein transpeptidase) n=1 Tax=Streptosporangium lutulentum TaxID=1461250 RepID=A0ABT9QRS3_9ACTN|nr:class F sortase [Streptosporangium lutulentum]MDP9849140.1 sortase (surface protein transpeptidase) [Streptosporangium lutulentum]